MLFNFLYLYLSRDKRMSPESLNNSHVSKVSSSSSILPSGCDNTLRKTLLTTSDKDSRAPGSRSATHR